MTKEELRAHCKKQVKMCEEWAKGNDREPSGKIYEEHKLILDLINELQDKSYELWKESYEEEHRRNIRLEEEIKALEQQQPSEDCVSRAEVKKWLDINFCFSGAINHLKTHLGCVGYRDYLVTELDKLEKIEHIINNWNNDASHSFEDMCKINGILKE